MCQLIYRPYLVVAEPLRVPRPNLVVNEPFERVVRFFGADRSSASQHSYDAYVAAGLSPPHRIVEADILAINATMSAR